MALWPDLRVDNKDKRAGSSEDHFVVKGGVEEVNLAWEVPDLEADKGAARDILSANLIGAFQEQGLVGRHFMENHLLDGGLPTPAQAHQQYPWLDLAIQRITEAQLYASTKELGEYNYIRHPAMATYNRHTAHLIIRGFFDFT